MPISPPQWVVNVADLSPSGFDFVELPSDVDRIDFSGLPRNLLEQLIRKPKLSRYRAALQAVRAAHGRPIISHLPRMTFAVSMIQSLLGERAPHLAFSFNFTELPVGASRRYLAKSYERVDEFFVFSEYERQAYPRHFSLPSERFRRLIWTQDPPTVSHERSPFPKYSYVSAVGGEGRDYASLTAAAEALPDIEFVIIARPYNIISDLPRNVRLLTNVPLEQTWRIALESSCLVVPLQTRVTCCGHITLVAGELLGIPVISTTSEATREYTDDVALCEPGDVGALIRLIREHHEHAAEFRKAARARVPAKCSKYDRAQWKSAVWSALERHL